MNSAGDRLRFPHLWLGLLGGLIIAVLGVSGSALVVRADLEQLAVKSWLVIPQGEQRPLDELIAAALGNYPARVVARLHWSIGASGTLEVVTQLPGGRNLTQAKLISVYVNPIDGVIVGTRDRSRGVV